MQEFLDWIADRIEPFGLFRTLITLIFTGLGAYTIIEGVVFVRTIMRSAKGTELEEEAEVSAQAESTPVSEAGAFEVPPTSAEPKQVAGIKVAPIRAVGAPDLSVASEVSGPEDLLASEAEQAPRIASQRIAAVAADLQTPQSTDTSLLAAWQNARMLRATASAFGGREMTEERRKRLESLSEKAISIGKKLVYIRLLKIVSFSTLRFIFWEVLMIAALLVANAYATYTFYTMD